MGEAPRDRVRTALDRIDPGLCAFITVAADAALRRAEADPGGRLRGLVLAVKDVFETAGLRTTHGSPRYRDHVPSRTASAVARLEREGAIVIGKTNLNELAYGVSGYNPHFGLMRTPADRGRTPGGSSGGSAIAVAAGVCDVALGTDTSGSVRIPAACCGVLGFKCAHGAVPTQGVLPLAPSLDSIGYLARSVEVLQRVLGIAELPAHPGRLAAGADLDLPALPFADHWTLFREEAYALHRERAREHPEEFGDDVRLKLAQPVGDTAAARASLARWRADFERAAAGVDLVVLPVFPGAAPTVREVLDDYAQRRLTTSDRLLAVTPVANALGWPALAVPTPDGPRQVLGRPGSEPALLAAGARMLV